MASASHAVDGVRDGIGDERIRFAPSSAAPARRPATTLRQRLARATSRVTAEASSP
jgi:hypothetical protein